MLLVLGNPRQWESLLRIAELYGKPFIRVSDQRGAGDIWFMQRMYEVLPRVDSSYLPPTVTDQQVLQIILRCKFLRILNPSLAYRLVIAGYHSWKTLLEEYNVTAVLSRPVDYYLNDILVRLAALLSIPHIGLSESPAAGMTLVQTMAEYNPVREPSKQEIASYLLKVAQPGHVTRYSASASKNFLHHCASIIEHHMRDLRRAAKRTLDRDPLNFHNNIARFFPRPKRLRDFPAGIKFEASAPVRADKPLIFWPLAWTPENTNDYYCPGLDVLDYEMFVGNVCRALAPQAVMLVKDHINIVGTRRRAFYTKLTKIPNVVLLDPRTPATQLFDQCDAVLLGTGTAGMEAIAHRRLVIRHGFNYWTTSENSVYLHPRRLLSGDVDLAAMINTARYPDETWKGLAELTIARLLSASIPGNVMRPRLSPRQREIEVAKAMPLVREILDNPSKLKPVVFSEDFPDE